MSNLDRDVRSGIINTLRKSRSGGILQVSKEFYSLMAGLRKESYGDFWEVVIINWADLGFYFDANLSDKDISEEFRASVFEVRETLYPQIIEWLGSDFLISSFSKGLSDVMLDWGVNRKKFLPILVCVFASGVCDFLRHHHLYCYDPEEGMEVLVRILSCETLRDCKRA